MKGSEVICLLVLFAVASTTENIGFLDHIDYVSISDTAVTLLCPMEDGKVDPNNLNNTEFTSYTDQNNGLHFCNRGSEKFYFYTKLKVCKGCVEMGTGLVLTMMIGDILLTAGVILIVYVCAKRKAAPAPPQRAANPRQANAPLPPNPDYQRLNPATRSKDIYAEAKRPY
ncbi:T-cell surface glycoprotein CD3 epsilon chain-like [Salminus brasiliensis]|uniref:T-cell surface glycoprotein CD3 epsilon chain-like n=1 Tax=Salminus brasiliensis TaxID=930266 RepID=UPI003B82E8C7